MQLWMEINVVILHKVVVVMCLPPGVMKREATVGLLELVFLFWWLTQTSTDTLCLTQPAPHPPVPEALFKSQAHCETKAQVISAILLSDNCS